MACAPGVGLRWAGFDKGWGSFPRVTVSHSSYADEDCLFCTTGEVSKGERTTSSDGSLQGSAYAMTTRSSCEMSLGAPP